jgi:hypothetical protein
MVAGDNFAASTLPAAAVAALKAEVKAAASFLSTAAFALSIAAVTGAKAVFATSLLAANFMASALAAVTAVPAATMSLAFAAVEALPSSVLIVAREVAASTFGTVGAGVGVDTATAVAVGDGLAVVVPVGPDSQAPTSKAADNTPMDKETFTRFFFIILISPSIAFRSSSPERRGFGMENGAEIEARAIRLTHYGFEQPLCQREKKN